MRASSSCSLWRFPGLRGNPDHVAVTTLVQPLGLEDDIQRLVPRHVLQAQGDVALHGVRGNDIELRLAGDQRRTVRTGMSRSRSSPACRCKSACRSSRAARRGCRSRRDHRTHATDRARAGLGRDPTMYSRPLPVGHRFERRMGAQDRAVAGGIHAVDRRREVGHVDDPLQVGRDPRIAEIDDHASNPGCAGRASRHRR